MLSKEKERIDWVDILKGIGIIAVITGHFLGFFGLSKPDHMIIYCIHSFDLPLFFFISGYLYKQENNLTNVVKKTCQLIIPYVAIMFFLLPFLYFFDVITEIKIKEIVQYLFWGGRMLKWILADIFVPMWFLPCLFLISVSYNFLSSFLSNIKLDIAILILLSLAYINAFFYPLFSLPWNLQTVLFTIAIFHIGRRIQEHNFNINWKLNVILSIFVFAYILSFEGNYLDMLNNIYGYPFVTLMCTIITIMLIKNISILFATIKPLKIGLSWLGRISLTIMAFHYPIYFIVEKYYNMNLLEAIVIALVVSSLLHWIFNQFKITQILLLGKGFNKEKFNNLLSKIKKNETKSSSASR